MSLIVLFFAQLSHDDPGLLIYSLPLSRYLSGADPAKVTSAKAETHPKPQIDVATTATLAFPTPGESTGPADGLTATLRLSVHFRLPQQFGFIPQWPKVSMRATGTRGAVELSNFVPWIYHNVNVESSGEEGGPLRKRTEKRHGNLGWTT